MKKLLYVLPVLMASATAFGAEGWSESQAAAIKAGPYFIAVAIAAYGGTKAQSVAASRALEGIARNPAAADKIMTPMILSLALMESLVIFTLITTFLV